MPGAAPAFGNVGRRNPADYLRQHGATACLQAPELSRQRQPRWRRPGHGSRHILGAASWHRRQYGGPRHRHRESIFSAQWSITMANALQNQSSILITGASGMVGRSLVARLRRDGFVNLLTPLSLEVDMRDQVAVERYFANHKIDYVFHLAGHIGGIGASVTYPVEFLYENMMISLHVINAARRAGVAKLLYLSSSCVYPRDCAQPMKEDD